jgi:hypothetical protein
MRAPSGLARGSAFCLTGICGVICPGDTFA